MITPQLLLTVYTMSYEIKSVKIKSWLNLCMGLALMTLSACSQRQGPPAPVVNGVSRGNTTVHNSLPSIIIKSGETVYIIAQRYRVDPQEIITLNNLKNPYHLRKGQKLSLPQNVMGGGTKSMGKVGHATPFPSAPPKSGQVIVESLDDKDMKLNNTHNVKAEPLLPPSPAHDNTTSIAPETASAPQKFSVVDQVLATKAKTAEKAADVTSTASTSAMTLMSEVTPTSMSDSKDLVVKKTNTLDEQRDARRGKIDKRDLVNKIDKTQEITAPDTDNDASSENKDSFSMPVAAEVQNAATQKNESKKRFNWPLRGDVIEKFGIASNGLRNDGINIRANEGDSIKSAEDGTVVYAGNEISGFGNLVMVRHSHGWMSAYAYCSEILVKRGQTVKSGDIVAKVGHTGSVRAPQLHFELREKTIAVDPMNYLKP